MTAHELGKGPFDGHIVATQVTAKAAVLEGDDGEGGKVYVPAVLLELGKEGVPAELRTKVALVGAPHVLRQLGRLVRDTANQAALRADREAKS